jgi:signal peptidase II
MILLAIMCNFGCDQITKNIVRQQVEYHENISIIDNFLTLTKVENSGAFLSLGSALPFFIKFLVLYLLPALVLLYGAYLLVSKKNISALLVCGLCFVIGGGTGNLYDRFRFGSVTDFLHIDFGILQTGIFNMADVSIMAGMGLMLADVYLRKVANVSQRS